MTLTVSVSQLRGNMSQYLERVEKGAHILIRDEKRNITVAQITKTHLFDKSMYEKALRKATGILTAQNHPEWNTKSDVVGWVIKNRLSDERSF